MVDKKQNTVATGKPGTVYVPGLPNYISAHHDNKGRLYFYNTISRVSAWDCSSLINQPAAGADGKKVAAVNQTATKAQQAANVAANNALSKVMIKDSVASPKAAGKKRSLEGVADDNSSDGDNTQVEDAVKIGVLEKVYDHDRFPSKETREMLARELGMSVRRIETWFTRRRSKTREEANAQSPKGAAAKRQKTEPARNTKLSAAQTAAALRAQQNSASKALTGKAAAAAASASATKGGRGNAQTMAQKVAAAQKKAIANMEQRPEVIIFELLQELSSHAHKAIGTSTKAERRFPSLEQLETCFTACKPIQKIVTGELSLDDNAPSDKKFTIIELSKLSVCSYVRSSTSTDDLRMKFNYAKQLLSVMVYNEETKLHNKLEIDFNSIDGVAVDMPHDQSSVMTIQLTYPPRFMKEISVGPCSTTTWIACDDFTLNQSSTCRRITFLFPKDILRAPLEALMKKDKRIKRLAGIGGEAFSTNMYFSKTAKKSAALDIPDRLMDILSSTVPGDDTSMVDKLVWDASHDIPTDEQGLPFDTQLPSLDGENIFSVLATMHSGDDDSHSDIRGEGMLSPGEFLIEKEDISDWLGEDSNQVSGPSTPMDTSPHDDELLHDMLLPEEVCC